jgi:hypothetical protein
VYKIYFWVSYCRPWFLCPETKKLVISFLCIYIFASLLSVHCVAPHWRSHKPCRISTLKPNIIFVITSLTTAYCWEWIINSREIARRCQHWRLKVSLQKKISGTYLIFTTSLPEDEQTSKHGGGGRYDAILELKGEQIKKIWERKRKKWTRKKK